MNEALRQLVTSGVSRETTPLSARLSDTWSGASILGGTITIATVCRDPNGHFHLDDAKSGQFELASRDQGGAGRLHDNLTGFFRRSQLSDVFLRRSSGRGPSPAKAEGHMCEGILYLVMGVQTHSVSPFSLTPWLREKGYDLPAQVRDRAWHLAIATAIYGAERKEFPSASQKTVEANSMQIRARIRASSEGVRKFQK